MSTKAKAKAPAKSRKPRKAASAAARSAEPVKVATPRPAENPAAPRSKPRLLVVTPEITYLPSGMGNMAQRMHAKAGGLADVSASLVSALLDLGADVHVALPNYRQMFNTDIFAVHSKELSRIRSKLPDERIHLAEDCVFYYRDQVYSAAHGENQRIALAFQREVINRIIHTVKPNLIHCNDWMTGLVPAAARSLGIPCLFTVHNIHTEKLSLGEIEHSGLDAGPFAHHFYFEQAPHGGWNDWSNRVDLMATGIFAAHYINTVSPSFLDEVADGHHSNVPQAVRSELRNKRDAGCGVGILNAPDPSYTPSTDPALPLPYTAENFREGKRAARRAFCERTGLAHAENAPLFFWPSRLDPVQKGPQLLAAILYQIISDYWDQNLQVAVVANGDYQRHFRNIVHHHEFLNRVVVCDFEESLSRLGYAAADYMLMPSSFEPCGLPQMISPIYGTLPVVHKTGGLKDTVDPLNVADGTGNGFLFDYFDTGGLRWAIDRTMEFHRLPADVRDAQITRIMRESVQRFNHETTASRYFEIYEAMLRRPLVV
ncbi:MAG: glycogen/starch synthase [Verrucomicrobiales bacterium]|nr:glycogen/starch synthase [Verrucomicrobiales bacterium]